MQYLAACRGVPSDAVLRIGLNLPDANDAKNVMRMHPLGNILGLIQAVAQHDVADSGIERKIANVTKW